MTGKDVLRRYQQLEALRSPHEWLWNEIGYLTNAKYYDNKQGKKTHGFIPHTDIYDTTLRTKSRMQANGLTSMLFPRDRDWLNVKPPWEHRHDGTLKKIYREGGEAVIEYLRASNFHHVNHGVIVHRSQIGTGCMMKEWMEDDNGQEVMNFRRFEPLRYLIDTDVRGMVSVFACEYQYSAFQAANEWGIKNLSPKLQKEALQHEQRNQQHKFIMLIERRAPWEREGKKGNKAMPFRQIVVEQDGENIVREVGMESFPIVASRYETADSPWGYPPAWEVLPDGYKANYCAKFMAVMGERAAVPPIVAPASMKEEGVGLNAAEVTYVSEQNPNLWPQQLGQVGNFQVGMDVWKMFQNSIDEAFHGNLFHMFSRLDRQRTATEVMAMQGELNAQIDPTVTALHQDHVKPVVSWAFNTLYEKGVIDLPDEVLNQKTGQPKLPSLAFDNALTMNHRKQRAVEALGLVDFFANTGQIDILKADELSRRIWRDHGQNEDELLGIMEYNKNQEAKAEAMQQEQAMQGIQAAAQAGKDAASAGVPVGEALAGAGLFPEPS